MFLRNIRGTPCWPIYLAPYEDRPVDAWRSCESHADAYLSANRTCEMGMRHATGRPYESFLFALEKLSRAEQDRTGEEF